MFSSKHAQNLVTTMPNDLNQSTTRFRQLPAAALELPPFLPSGVQRSVATSINSLSALITPIDNHGRWSRPHVVEVKDFTERGITFHHEMPLSDRRAMVVLESPQLGRVTAEVDLTWCRFTRSGRYISGGRFVQRANRSA